MVAERHFMTPTFCKHFLPTHHTISILVSTGRDVPENEKNEHAHIPKFSMPCFRDIIFQKTIMGVPQTHLIYEKITLRPPAK